MASQNFTILPRALALALHNFGSDSLKVLLVSSIPSEANFDAWTSRADVTNEITGTGYTAGGIAQAYTLETLDTTNNRQEITLSDNASAWTSATISAVGAIIYKDSGTAATDYLISFVDYGGTVAVTNGTFGLTYTNKLIINW